MRRAQVGYERIARRAANTLAEAVEEWLGANAPDAVSS